MLSFYSSFHLHNLLSVFSSALPFPLTYTMPYPRILSSSLPMFLLLLAFPIYFPLQFSSTLSSPSLFQSSLPFSHSHSHSYSPILLVHIQFHHLFLLAPPLPCIFLSFFPTASLIPFYTLPFTIFASCSPKPSRPFLILVPFLHIIHIYTFSPLSSSSTPLLSHFHCIAIL